MDTTGHVPKDLQEWLERELQPGERIQWIDVPVRRLFPPGALLSFLTGMFFAAFASLWTALLLKDARDQGLLRPLALLVGIVFLAIGVAMLASPLWMRRKARRTVYAVTSRRAISVEQAWFTTVRSYWPGEFQHAYRREKEDGSGDIIFLIRPVRGPSGNREGAEELGGFAAIRNVSQVEQALRQLISQGGKLVG